jgi:hypothetical protein
MNTPNTTNSFEKLNRHQRRFFAANDRRMWRKFRKEQAAYAARGGVGPGPTISCHPDRGYRIGNRPGRPDLVRLLRQPVVDEAPEPTAPVTPDRDHEWRVKAGLSAGPPPPGSIERLHDGEGVR